MKRWVIGILASFIASPSFAAGADEPPIKEIGFAKVDVSKLGLPDDRLRILLDGREAFPVGHEKYILVGETQGDDYKFEHHGDNDFVLSTESCSVTLFDAATAKMVTKRFPQKPQVARTVFSPTVPDSMEGPSWTCLKINESKVIPHGGLLTVLVSAEGNPVGGLPHPPVDSTQEAQPKTIEILYPITVDVERMSVDVDAKAYAILWADDSPYRKNIGTGKHLGVDGFYRLLQHKPQ
jgi:hypothetical protein